MNTVERIKKRFTALEANRRPWENYWQRIASFAVPDMQQPMLLKHAYNAVVGVPESEMRSPMIYDSTSLMAIDRGAAGEISLVMPSSSQWHELGSDDPFAPELSDEEERWFDDTADYMFKARYNPKSGFALASKAAIKSRWAFGTGVMFLSENKGKGASAPILYQHVPLMENFLATDFNGFVNTNYRRFSRSAEQCVEQWGDKCSATVQEMAADPIRASNPVTIIHAVEPNQGKGKKYSSIYIEPDNDHLIGESGFVEFPYVVLHWSRDHQGPYSESPLGLALSEIGSLNELSKQELLATQTWVNPPTAMRSDDFNPPDMSPGAPNPGMLNEAGELLIKPIVTQQRPDFAQTIIQAKRDSVREMLYVNLWQILISNPQMTATEAMIRAQEKGDLLGPSGLSLQMGLAHMVDREFSILQMMGAFAPGAPLAYPESLGGTSFGVTFTGPLDKMRRSNEVIGMQRVMEIAGQAAMMAANGGQQQTAQDIIARMDFDEILDISQDVLGAPRKMFKPRLSDDEREEREAEGSQQEQLMAAIMAAQAGGDAAQSAGAGAQALQGAGLLPAPQNAEAA